MKDDFLDSISDMVRRIQDNMKEGVRNQEIVIGIKDIELGKIIGISTNADMIDKIDKNYPNIIFIPISSICALHVNKMSKKLENKIKQILGD